MTVPRICKNSLIVRYREKYNLTIGICPADPGLPDIILSKCLVDNEPGIENIEIVLSASHLLEDVNHPYQRMSDRVIPQHFRVLRLGIKPEIQVNILPVSKGESGKQQA